MEANFISAATSSLVLVPCSFDGWILPLSLLLNKSFRKRKKEEEGGREELTGKGGEESQRGERRLRGAVPASPWPQEEGCGTAPLLCQESPWRLSAGLFMINTPRQLSSWSLLKYIHYYLNTMIFRAERSRWVGEGQ